MTRRNRSVCIAATLFVIALGLASRKWPSLLPAVLGKYPGDALWAAMMFALCCIAWPRGATWRLAAIALAICWAVEVSQLYHAPWIDAIRATPPGHLVLGSAFHAVDLVAYAVGVMIAAFVERAAARRPGTRAPAAPQRSEPRP